MNRRNFIAAGGMAAAAPFSSLTFAQAAQVQQPEFYELRQYHLLYGPKQRLVQDYLQNAAIPAYNRLGINPVGVFQVTYGANAPSLYVLLPHPDIDSFLTATERLMADEAHNRDGAAYLDASMADPAYVRMESSLLRAFAAMPRLEVPPQKVENRARIFELRYYESHSEKAGINKLDMFNAGEIPIFRRTGLTPVFFGHTLVGTKMPSLVYMLAFDDLAARDRAWQAFSADPDWATMRSDPQWAGNVSAISDIILRPAAYSQV